MAIILIRRVSILVCILLGGLFAVHATVGKEWQKFEQKFPYGYVNPRLVKEKYYAGLWEFCSTHVISYLQYTICGPVNSQLKSLKNSITGNYYFFS